MNMRSTKLILFGCICALGIANIVVTLNHEGGTITSIGVLIGVILFLMGAIRIYLALRHDA
jgi:hypothetical protein